MPVMVQNGKLLQCRLVAVRPPESHSADLQTFVLLAALSSCLQESLTTVILASIFF